MAFDEATAARIRKILSGRRGVVEKKLMGGLAFMVGGTMACSVGGKSGLLVRVGPGGMDGALAEPHACRMKMGGKTMSGFVQVQPDGYRADAALRKWVERGLDFVATLPARQAAKARRK